MLTKEQIEKMDKCIRETYEAPSKKDLLKYLDRLYYTSNYDPSIKRADAYEYVKSFIQMVASEKGGHIK